MYCLTGNPVNYCLLSYEKPARYCWSFCLLSPPSPWTSTDLCRFRFNSLHLNLSKDFIRKESGQQSYCYRRTSVLSKPMTCTKTFQFFHQRLLARSGDLWHKTRAHPVLETLWNCLGAFQITRKSRVVDEEAASVPWSRSKQTTSPLQHGFCLSVSVSCLVLCR